MFNKSYKLEKLCIFQKRVEISCLDQLAYPQHPNWANYKDVKLSSHIFTFPIKNED